MLSLILYSFFVSNISAGPVFEPAFGLEMNDARDDEKVLAGVRISISKPKPSDANITGEIEALAATRFSDKQKRPDTDYIFGTGLVFYEIYMSLAFRLALGGSVELRNKDAHVGVYYRGSLGRYFTPSLGLFADLGGRALFREDHISLPLDLGLSLQFIF